MRFLNKFSIIYLENMKRLKFFVLVIFFALLNACSYYPELETDIDNIEIIEALKFIQVGSVSTAKEALIMYPGGLVDPLAYIDILMELVTDKRVVFIAKVPSNLAVLNTNIGSEIIKSFENIRQWSLIGHSLGGAMACSEVASKPEMYDHLILLGAYPAKSVDLTKYQGSVLSMSASMDAFTTTENIEQSKIQFNSPKSITDFTEIVSQNSESYFYEIQGGNHSNFGSYGIQRGDGEASISRKEQQLIVREFIQKLLDE